MQRRSVLDLPVTPEDVSLIEQGDTYVYRTKDALALYQYDRDSPGRSMCTKACALTWPPYIASEDAHVVGDWSFVTRQDGSRQWAYKTKPVYTYSKDTLGHSLGDGVGGVWHMLKV